MKTVILAPIDNSPYSRAVTTLCLNEPGIEVAGMVIRRILNPARIRSELRRDGVRLIRKAWKKLVLGSEESEILDEPGFVDVARQAGCTASRLSQIAKEAGIPVLKVDDHNDADSIAALRRWNPDVVAFTGGGIIRQALLDVAGRGIFNAHMGLLPRYRGMDVVEWPVLEGASDRVGVTLHFMNRGIDTGPIILKRPVPIQPGDSMERLRKRFEPAMVDVMIDGLRAVRDGTLEVTTQTEAQGQQYFIMHPRFYQEARKRLAASAGRDD